MTDHIQNTNDDIIKEATEEAVTAASEATPVEPEVKPVESTIDSPVAAAMAAPKAAPAPITAAQGTTSFDSRGPRRTSSRPPMRGGSRPGGAGRGGPRREPRAKPEFDQKIIDIRRVTRVSSGGRRFSFAVSLVAGDRKGKVGVGTGKGGDTAMAVDKALRSAKKNMITLNLTKSGSIPHEVEAKFSSARVHMMPAPGKGLVAGSSVRDVIDLGGVKDITAKLRSGSKNKLNNARVAIEALKMLKKPRAHSK